MNKLTIDELRLILVACAGAEDEAAPDQDITDLEFEELGYDSLALMETAAQLERDYGVQIPEEQIADIKTPGDMLELVNGRLAETA